MTAAIEVECDIEIQLKEDCLETIIQKAADPLFL